MDYRAWGQRLHFSGDLRAAYDELRGQRHWFSETCKGRVRLLQYRLREAEWHLKAGLLGALEEDTPISAFCAGLADLYRFELDWLLGRRLERGEAISPELEQCYRQRNAYVELRSGNLDLALREFRHAERHASNPAARATCKIGQACALASLGVASTADDCLFFAADQIPMVRSRLHKGQLYVACAMSWKALGEEERAGQMWEALNRLAIPYVTKDCLVLRYRAMFALSRRERRLLILA